ncbi:MAG: hypothetical protein ACQETO_12370, partial [Pseudomonadota bacterium]
EHGITIAWHRMNHMLGCSARWGGFGSEEAQQHFQTLQQPAGHHYMIGDQISHHPAWMESAIQSAHFALTDMELRIRQQAANEA